MTDAATMAQRDSMRSSSDVSWRCDRRLSWAALAVSCGLILVACQAHGANRPGPPAATPAPVAKAKVKVAPAPSQTAPAQSAAVQLIGVGVELRERKKLRVVNWVYKKKFSAGVGLDGTLEVRIHNTTKAAVAIQNLENHGLVFVDTRSKAEHLVVHACKCAEPADASSARPLKIAAGKTRKLALDDWGCGGGMWKAPPPGRYLLKYRVLGAPLSSPPARRKDPKQGFIERRNACEKRLRDPKHWRTAAVSNTLEIELKKPIRKRVR